MSTNKTDQLRPQRLQRGGYTPLPNDLFDDPRLADFSAEARHVVTVLLRAAQFEAGEFWTTRSHRVVVPRGSFAHSLTTLAEESRTSPKVVRVAIDRLLKRGWLALEGPKSGVSEGTHQGTNEGTHQGTVEGTNARVLRIVEYETYMTYAAREGTVEGTVEGTHQGTVEGTIKEEKYIKTERPEEREPAPATTPSLPVLSLDAAHNGNGASIDNGTEQVFLHWQKITGNQGVKITASDRKTIEKAIHDHGLDGALHAISGTRNVPEHELNGRTDLRGIFRFDDKVGRLIAAHRKTLPKPVTPEQREQRDRQRAKKLSEAQQEAELQNDPKRLREEAEDWRRKARAASLEGVRATYERMALRSEQRAIDLENGTAVLATAESILKAA